PAGGDPSAATPAPTPGGTGVTTENSDPGPAPPYAFPATSSDQETQGALAPGAAPGSASPSPAPSRSAPPAGGPPLRIGVAGGDPAQEAGFSAYVDLVNREGGLRGRLLEVVPVAPGTPAPGTIATVNLSPRPVSTPAGAPDWATGPLLETLTATEDLLAGGGRVFSFAGPPERQAHLAADAVFPQLAPTATAVVYRPVTAGPLRDAVPAAFVEVLEQRAVKVFVEDYDPAAPPTHLRSADAAFLSLDTASAGSWLRQAKAAGYAPARGVAGISTLFDPALLADLPEGSRVVSPYLVPGGAEGDAIRSGAGGTSAPVLHGWATAKSLAVALWRTGADTPGAVQTALEGLTGYDSGLAPPYETRPGTRSRTPEGVVFVVRSGAFTADGGFRRDPH
ncbi:MAG TPA: ABC transporter substrate-binding protein, partial [Acidimicrobiia bacterium]|nr:ABC transporter substrate-binding protein [Acidimicrobiia bacterium]